MATDLQRIARKALADAKAAGHQLRDVYALRAQQLTRERSGCTRAEAAGAVAWALDHQAAVDLPERSIVATPDSVYYKTGPGRWTEMTDGRSLTLLGDADVDEVIEAGGQLLRVGDGA